MICWCGDYLTEQVVLLNLKYLYSLHETENILKFLIFACIEPVSSKGSVQQLLVQQLNRIQEIGSHFHHEDSETSEVHCWKILQYFIGDLWRCM